MKISVLGTGNIGGTLGKKWANKGHTVKFGVRDVTALKHQTLLDSIRGEATVASIEEAIAFGEVVLLAIPGAAAEDVANKFGQLLDGKIIIDATNRVGQSELNSIAIMSNKAPEAHMFRAFNSLGWENFEKPHFDNTQVDLFYCGDSGQAQQIVDQLIADIGLRPIYVGDLAQVDVVDSVAKLWFALVFGQGYSRRTVFKLLME